MREFANHSQWSAVKGVCDRLSAAGHKALLAGGCVRDLVMGREPNDFDIATNATPDEVVDLFPNALTVGRSFGVTILPFSGFQIEVATFRRDLEYKDGRHPEGIEFSTPEEDAKRRDFTVNALFYDLESSKVIDFVGGQKDISSRLIRAVGRAEERFTEDKLRMLRAVRFAAQLGFEIFEDTRMAIVQLAPQARTVSRERVRDEILKLLNASGRSRGLELLISTGLLAALFPKLASDVFAVQRIWLERFSRASEIDPSLGLTLFFWPAFEQNTETEFRQGFLQDLRLDNRTVDTILFSLKTVSHFLKPAGIREGELILMLANPGASVARQFASIIEGEHLVSPVVPGRETKLEALARRALGPDRKKPDPLVSGIDAQALGLKPGPEMGRRLHEVYLRQLEGSVKTYDEALRVLKEETQ